VVIGEDDDAQRGGLCALLSRLSVDVVPAPSGSDLVMLLTGPEPVDLLIANVDLPWMSGLQVAAAARHSGLDMPIILMAASPSNELHAHIRRLCGAVLVSPSVLEEELLAMVRERLDLQSKTEDDLWSSLALSFRGGRAA
jgi:CheY-like chemotaxis protein